MRRTVSVFLIVTVFCCIGAIALRRTNSFVPATLVLMANGTTRSIADVQIGDMVMATDPETGERGPRKVTDTITGDGSKELVDIEIDGAVVTATDRHPFWVDDQGRWVDAEDLQAGDVLVLATGDTLTDDAVRERTAVGRVHNLTVDGIHTYYVVAGDDPVLVHNCAKPAGMSPDQRALKELVDEATLGGRRPLSVDDAETALDWADEVRYPGPRALADDVVDPSNWTANPVPHIHIPGAGSSGHVWVEPGVRPRPRGWL